MLCALRMGSSCFGSLRLWRHPLRLLLRHIQLFFALHYFRDDRNHSSLILNGSPTSKYTDSWKDSATCLYWSMTRVDYGLQAFVVFLRDFQGTEMFCGNESCSGVSARSSFIRER